MLARLIVILGLALGAAAPLAAQDIPPPLRDWQGWVLHDVPEHACPFLANQLPGRDSYQCAWPGRLTLEAAADGGHFALEVHVDAPSWVALPGDARVWPQAVTANNQGAVVLQHDEQPMLRLPPGDYQLRGSLPWAQRPAQLAVPAAIGLVTLSVDGKPVTRIERDGDELTLGEAAAATRTADALALRVYRKLDDGVPAMLSTQLQFKVAGSAREQLLGPALPAGFVATAISGDLPARLENDGRLRVQLRPGEWTITLTARATAPLDKLALQPPPAPWPRQEVWSYADDPALRNSRAEGQAVDAAQAGVPGDWAALPAFALDAAHGLNLIDGARGTHGGQGDQLQLQRALWLDFDGQGFSAVDHLTGTLRQHQRLDVSAPWQLQRASEGDQPLLVSRGEDGREGVEVRARQLSLDAGLRLPRGTGALPANGWQLPLEGIDAVVHLPHGYRLIAAPGADRAPTTWVARWSLLDLFVLALVAALTGRLLGWPWGLLAATYLALGQHEHGTPLWTLAVLLVLALLQRALPPGRLRGAARLGVLALFVLAVLASLPFATRQLQYALHPQLEQGAGGQRVAEQFMQPPAKIIRQQVPPPVAEAAPVASPAPPAPPPPPPPLQPPPVTSLSSVVVVGSAIPAGVSLGFDSRSLLQAGAGTPQWSQGNTYPLTWSGPVTVQQTMRLVIAPAWLVRLLRVLLVGLLAALLGKLALTFKPWQAAGEGLRVPGAASALLLALALLPRPAPAQNLPSRAQLDQLKARLTEAPRCAPDCATVAQAELSAKADQLDLLLQVHAGAGVAVPLPQADAGLQLQDVRLDGQPATLARDDDDHLLVRMERGVHALALHYRLGAVDTASLRFALRPQRVLFAGEGWTLAGVSDGRLQGDSLAVQKVPAQATANQAAPTQEFPPYVRLTRHLRLGVDWQVENRAERIAPADAGFSLSLPLLPGEHPLGDGVVVKDGRISLAFSAGQRVVRWISRLDTRERLALAAPALGERAEAWEVDAAPMWHVAATGVPGSASDAGLRFQPLPGETLQLAFSQPAAAGGGSLAFDRVEATSTLGERATETTLTLAARSTRGGEHAITLPVGAELLEARRDGEPLNLAVRDGKLGLPLLPGRHDYSVRLRTPQGIAARARTAAFELAAPAANIEQTLELPRDRWLLWSWGPTTGPAVLYWSQLAVLLLVAWLLARYAPTPLRLRHWLLLGLGFSAFAWGAYVLVVLWLIALGLRARHAPPARWFNLAQVGLAVFTVLALLVLVAAVPKGLLGVPDMHVAGNDSSAGQLHWFADRSAGALPAAGALSISLWWYKLAMLAWALWLAFALVGWLRWAFDAWNQGGYWRRAEPKPGVTAVPPLPGAPHD